MYDRRYLARVIIGLPAAILATYGLMKALDTPAYSPLVIIIGIVAGATASIWAHRR